MEIENCCQNLQALSFINLIERDTYQDNKKRNVIDLEQQNIKCQKPIGRFNHSSWIYKDKLFIFGGSTLSQQFCEIQNLIFCYNLIQKTWTHIVPRIVPKSIKLQSLSSMAVAQNNNRVYIFGGSNSDFQCNQDLLKIDLDTFDIFFIQQKGQVPFKRQGAKMTYYDKNWLILYGGLDSQQVVIYNDFYLFHIQTKFWYKVDGPYEYLLSYRDNSSLINHTWSKMLYLFGGSFYDSLNQKRFLNDLYQINVIFKTKLKPSISINKILSKTLPSGRSGQSLNSLNQKYLILISGQGQPSIHEKKTELFFDFSHEVLDDVWIFSVQKKIWFRLTQNHSLFLDRYGFSCCLNETQLYIFGGLDHNQNVLNDLIQIKINYDRIDTLNQLNQNQICRLCWQQANQYEFSPVQFSASYIDQILATIQYPFSAFGLLIDNAVHFESNKLVITYLSKIDQNSSLKIQYDSLFLPYTSSQLMKSFNSFCSQDIVHHSGSDKKMKNLLGKKRQKINFCNNIIIGGLRLGSKFLWVGNSQTQTFFFAIIKEIQHQQQVYKSYFFSQQSSTGQLINSQMQPTKRRLEQIFGTFYFKLAYSKKAYSNYMIIFELKTLKSNEISSRLDQINYQLVPSPQLNTLYRNCGNPSYISAGYFKNQSIDSNLSVYLSHLYLNSGIKILISICGMEYSQVNCQKSLQKIDRLVKTRDIIEVDSQFLKDFDCHVVQIYYNPTLNKNIGFYSNGLLIYHKNRLLMRYQNPLGSLGDIVRNQFKNEKKSKVKKDSQSNMFELFGFIQLPQKIPINLFKTGCLYPIMLEKLFNTIEYIKEAYYRQYNGFRKSKYDSKINIVDLLGPIIQKNSKQVRECLNFKQNQTQNMKFNQ